MASDNGPTLPALMALPMSPRNGRGDGEGDGGVGETSLSVYHLNTAEGTLQRWVCKG